LTLEVGEIRNNLIMKKREKSGRLNKDSPVINWLLEENQPPIRYLTLTQLLDRREKDSDARSAKKNITKVGWARDILDKQLPGGFWYHEKSLFNPIYVATFWNLLILSDLGLTKEEETVAKASELWMDRCATKDGGFSWSGKAGGHLCITGNSARALVKLGYEDHPNVRRAFEWIVKNQADKGGWSCWNFGEKRSGRTLDSFEPMSAFAVYPRQKWTRGMKQACESGAEFFLEHELHVQGDRYEPWYRFHYPIHYYYDLLVGLDFMTALGYSNDKRLEFAISLLKKKRRKDGRWNLDEINPDPESPQGKWDKKNPKKASSPIVVEKPGLPSKMITLTALKILNRIGDKIPVT
jgi:hypothetical protein